MINRFIGCKDLVGDVQEANASVVAALFSIAFFVDRANDADIFEQLLEDSFKRRTRCLQKLSRNSI